jgi:hypothetical protein
MLRVILELFIVEEELLACSENKLGAAVNAFQHPIGEFHGRLPSQGLTPNRPWLCRNLPVPVPCIFGRALQGPGPH